MPNRTALRIPSYRLHKTSGRAVVRLNGRDIYLGKHGIPERHANYNRVISEWTSNFRKTVRRLIDLPLSSQRLGRDRLGLFSPS